MGMGEGEGDMAGGMEEVVEYLSMDLVEVECQSKGLVVG